MQRLFVALDLPDGIRATLAAAKFDTETWRPVSEQSLHVTLAFLGNRPTEDVDRIAPIVTAEHEAPPLAIKDVLLLPPRRPRVLTVELDDPTDALKTMQARIATALEAAGVYTRESRPFRPHVTIGRARPRVRPRDPGLELAHTPFHGRSVTLYRSRLHPSGARYEALVSQPLGYIQP